MIQVVLVLNFPVVAPFFNDPLMDSHVETLDLVNREDGQAGLLDYKPGHVAHVQQF